MKQVFCSSYLSSSSIIDCYSNPANAFAWENTEANAQAPWPVAGVFRNLKVKFSSAATETLTLRIGGVDTALTVSVAGATDGELSGVDVTVAAGDLVSLQLTGGAPSITHLSMEFEGDNVGESGYITSGGAPTTSSATFNALFRGSYGGGGSDVLNFRNLVGIPGSVDSIYWNLSAAPGAGKSWTFTIYLNGVAQDGSGGTPDTRVTIADAATTGTASFTLALVALDQVSVEMSPTGTPAAAHANYGVGFTATIDGYSQFCGRTTSTLNTSQTTYGTPSFPGATGGWSLTESAVENAGGISSFRLKGLVVALSSSPGTGGDGFTFTGRVNEATPTGAPSVTIVDANDDGSDAVGLITVNSTDTFALQCAPLVSPGGPSASWAFGMYVASQSVRGSAVFGESTTVTAPRAIAMGLDGNTNVHAVEGMFKVFGKGYVTGEFIAGLLTADPASPVNDTWWVVRSGTSPTMTVALKARIAGTTQTIAAITL